uniref:BRX domain-containing protein n=1 Tax=Aegilops tauschii subsp. strangulata TaxID=200361 RepID=A0A453CUL0_AEGTS
QLKDMVLKFSGSSKHYKGAAAGSPSFRSYRRPYPGFVDDTTFTPTGRPASDAGAYTRTSAAAANGSARAASSATWDMTGRGWPGVDEQDGGEIVAAGGDAAVPREWTAQVEPGVQITFVTLPGGGNDLKRIRFSREMFNKWEAQRWWGENYDRIVELYNVQTFSGRQQGASTPTSSVDDSRDSSYSRGGSTRDSPVVMMPPPPPSSSSSKDPMSRSVSCKGGVLPVRGGRAGPVRPRVGAPLQHAQLRGGRRAFLLRPVARHHLLPRRGLRVHQQRQRHGGDGVDRAGRARRVPHHPRARRRHPRAPPRPVQPGEVWRGPGEGVVGAEQRQNTGAVSV